MDESLEVENRENLNQARPMVVLVVDDDEMLREVTAMMIEEAGGKVLAAGSGKEGVATLQNTTQIDVAMLDFSMPEMNGCQTMRALRQLKPDLPVLLVSGLRNIQEVEEITQDSSDVRFLRKPYQERELLDALRSLSAKK